jgi:hypothetical protein
MAWTLFFQIVILTGVGGVIVESWIGAWRKK